jgi:hypothetical protein
MSFDSVHSPAKMNAFGGSHDKPGTGNSTAVQVKDGYFGSFQITRPLTCRYSCETLSIVARAAVGFIVTITLVDTTHAADAACKTAARHLVTLIKHDWPSSNESTPAATDMVAMIARKSPASFVAGAKRFALKYSRREFTEQAERSKPPFTPSGELLKALDDLDADVVVTGLPGTNILAANSIGGTANCNSTVFFSTGNRRSRLVQGPESWKNDVGGSCGLTRSFASIDRLPVVIDDRLDFGPSLTSTLTLTPWIDGKWMEPCEANFVFTPHFDPRNTLNDWASLDNWEANKCGNDCEGFGRASLELVRLTQLDPAGVEAHLLAAMSQPQRQEYRRLKRISDRPDAVDVPTGGDDAERPAGTASLTDKTPLVLPMVVDNRVFLATLGHFTIGWRVFSDWKITVETGEADKTSEIARFAVGMTKGPIASAAVK